MFLFKFGPILNIKLSAKFLTCKCNLCLNVIRIQKLSTSVSKGTKDLFKSTINIPSSTGPNEEPKATPSVCK